ncbi:hypothetical protein LOD99_5597 [Oopsacas minuta]|uniref:Uncharacterized protein n=1 Tax=Oopsacas minuta TaxID=111878 RepID=A0AAV7JRN0_9METZ|nr:hypothetical protein LOD99_5597 [Oopsacas minuta]
MNWVGGTLSRLRGRDDKKIQREFFEKKRYEKNLDSIPIGMQSPTKKIELAISQDLLSLQTVLHTHSESNNRLYKQFKHPNMLDLKPKLGIKRTISYDFLQESVLNEKKHRNEGFQDLETPSNFLDIKKWRGEYKQSRALGLSKANSCLRQFQVSEQNVFQREGVDYCEKETIYPNEEHNCDSIIDEVVAVESEDNNDVNRENESYIQWNKKVSKEEPNNATGNSKWLEFLYGKNNANRGEIIAETTQTDQTTHNSIVKQSLVSTNPTTSIIPQRFIKEHGSEDLMEFERESIFRSKPGYSEDPFYLTLSSNRDSFKGYKRPRIDTCSSGLAVHKVNSDQYTGFLDESVFATPTEVNITRPDGNLTENPLPYFNNSGMKSIREFIQDKTAKYDKYHDALTDEELMENSDEDSSEGETIVNIPKVNSGKSRFVVPFVKKEPSPKLVPAPIEEKPQTSKSYDRFLQSLVAPNNSMENKANISSTEKVQNVDYNSLEETNHPLLQNNDNINSLMMPIAEWKAKELAIEINSPVAKDLVEEHCYEPVTGEDKGILNDGSYVLECNGNADEYLVRNNDNSAEKTVSTHLEADTNMSETNSDIQLVRDENNIGLVSNSSQLLDNESNGKRNEPIILEQYNNYGEKKTGNNVCKTDTQNMDDCVKIEHRFVENENEIETKSISEETNLETNAIIRDTDNDILDSPNEIAATTNNDSTNIMSEITELQADSDPIMETLNPDLLCNEDSNKNNGITSYTQEVVSEETSHIIGSDSNQNHGTQQEPNHKQEVGSGGNSQTFINGENNTKKDRIEQEQVSEDTSEITDNENNTNKEVIQDCIQDPVSEETNKITNCVDIQEVGSEEVKPNENIESDNSSIEIAELDASEESCIPGVQETIVTFMDVSVQYSQQDKNVGPIPVTEGKDCQTCLESIEKEPQLVDHQTQTEEHIQKINILDITKSKKIQTEELTHNSIGNQTDILLIEFPITSDNEQIINTNDKLTQAEYENYIIYQQQIIRALQEESKLKYPLQ